MKSFFGFAVLCIAAFFVFSAMRDNKTEVSSGERSSISPKDLVDEGPPIQIDAISLFLLYKQNEIAADQQFKGKIVEVTGTVSQIRKDFADNAILQLATTNQFETVDARINQDSVSSAAKLVPGVSVIVLCRGNGMIVGSPELVNCSIK